MRRHVVDLARRWLSGALSQQTDSPNRELWLSLGTELLRTPVRTLAGPPPGPAMVVAPHPDDETIGCGGTVARHLLRGDHVDIVVVTSGDQLRSTATSVQLRRRREQECIAAVAKLGQPATHFLRYPDGRLNELRYWTQLAEYIRRLRAEGQHAVVYAPWAFDDHPDHAAVFRAVASLEWTGSRTLFYEVSTPVPANVVIDISSTYPAKADALATYHSAFGACDYRRTTRALAQYRTLLGGMKGRGYAEAFLELDSKKLERVNVSVQGHVEG